MSESSKKEFIKKIEKDLEKSGFASEMRALQIFIKNQWSATGMASFFDKDLKKPREGDILSHKCINGKTLDKKEIQVFFQIVAEVKKSEKPWILFKELPYYKSILQEGWTGLIFYDGVSDNNKLKCLTKTMLDSGLGVKTGWLASGIHESFKSPDNHSKWYSSCCRFFFGNSSIL